MKDEMYTYQYFKNRCIIRSPRTSDYLVQATVLCGMAYAIITLVVIFR